MDIYSAEIQVNKLLNYVKGLSDSKPRMYQKSKDRLKELANTCTQVVSVISELLQDEALINNDPDSSDEFGLSDKTDFNAALNSIEHQLVDLRKFLNSSSSLSSEIVVSSESSVENSVSEIDTGDRKQAIQLYKQCFQKLSSENSSIFEADSCGKLLWSWFSHRFLEVSDTFHYNMKRLPNWVRDIVILYGYHLETDSLSEFLQTFQKWIDDVDAGTNNYAVPYEIYMMNKKPSKEFMTLTAVVLWDVLLDSGLRDICMNASSGLYPSDDCVYSLVGSLNSEVMNPYTNYMYDESILKLCKLTKKVGGSK